MHLKPLFKTICLLILLNQGVVAQSVPAQTDLYNISLTKLQNITKDSLKTKLKTLQTQPDQSLSIEQMLQKYFLETVVGDQYQGLKQFQDLSQKQTQSYEFWNTYAWSLYISEKYSQSELSIQKAIDIHPAQLLGSDQAFLKMVESSKGNIAAKSIFSIPSENYYDFLTLQTIPKNTDTLIQQIHYLLWNRLQYLPQQDSITAQLLIDAGDLIAKKEDRNKGLHYYQYALTIDSSFQPLVQIRKDVIEDGKRTVKETFNWASVIWAIPLVALAFIGAATLKSYKK